MPKLSTLDQYLLVTMVAALMAARGCFDGEPGPGPSPTPSERGIDLPGVAVLVVYQDADLAQYTQQQRDIVSGYLWSDKVEQGNWRVLDADATFAADSPFRPAFERRPSALPWCVISGPGAQYEGALPATVAEMAQRVEGAKHG